MCLVADYGMDPRVYPPIFSLSLCLSDMFDLAGKASATRDAKREKIAALEKMLKDWEMAQYTRALVMQA